MAKPSNGCLNLVGPYSNWPGPFLMNVPAEEDQKSRCHRARTAAKTKVMAGASIADH